MVYLNKVYNWPMSLTPRNGESDDMPEKSLRERKKGRLFMGKKKLVGILLTFVCCNKMFLLCSDYKVVF